MGTSTTHETETYQVRCASCGGQAAVQLRPDLPKVTGTIDTVTIRCSTGHVDTFPARLWSAP